MENDSNSGTKTRASFSEAVNNKDSPVNENQCPENRRDHTNTKRDRDRDVASNGDRASFNKRTEDSLDKDNKVLREEQPVVQSVQQTSNFPPFNYNSTDHLFVDKSRHALSVLLYNEVTKKLNTNRSRSSRMAPVNALWPVNSFENVAMNEHNVTANQPTVPMGIPLDMQSSTSITNPYAFMGMPGENMYGVVGMRNYCQYGGVPAQENMFFPPIKEVIQLTKSVLYPPNPNAPRPTTRERPLGCKTVFVGGLPEKITEEIMREIFERCGTVETIRMSKKNFCHIRFSDELYTDNALYFSGYRLKIENKAEAPFTGRLHVDYAEDKNDQYDFECKQRALQRQARHQELDYCRPPTPPEVEYNDKEASLICEKLKNEETFTLAASILITWLEKGECTKKNASSFFSMIQSTHNHVIKLQLDKGKYEDQLTEAKKMLKKQLDGIVQQFSEIEKIYKVASLQKCWDQFSKTQRKNIKMWKKQTEELKNALLEQVISEREDEEMELSDDENSDKTKTDSEQVRKQCPEDVHKYQEEADSLRCQLKSAQNEIMVMQSNHKEELDRKDNLLATMRQAFQNSKREELNSAQKRSRDEVELKELRAFKRRMMVENPDCVNDSASESNSHLGTLSNANSGTEARLIGLISIFLHVHPFGANIDYICAYLNQIDSTIKSIDVENLLKRYPMIFKENSTGIGATLGKKWHFTAV